MSGKGMSDAPVFPLQAIAYLVSHACSGTCLHCSFSDLCHVDDYDSSVVDRLFLDVPDCLSDLVLTGGEPLDFLERSMKIIERAAGLGLAVSIVTSGSFARRWRTAKEWIDEAAPRGLQGLSLSVDRYHRPALSARQRVRLVEHCLARGVHVHLKGLGSGAGPMIDAVLDGVADDTRVTVSMAGLERVGRAESLGEVFSGKSGGPCHNLVEPSVYPDGQVFACCSVFGLEMQGSALQIGCLRDESLTDILDLHRRDYLFAALRYLGPLAMLGWLPQAMKRRFKSLRGCRLCMGMLGDDEAVIALRGHIDSHPDVRKLLHGHGMISEMYGDIRCEID